MGVSELRCRHGSMEAEARQAAGGAPMTTPTAADIEAVRKRLEREPTFNRCANCGTLVENARTIITGGWLCDEEFVCSKSCHAELEKLGCPHESGDNYRARPLEVLEHEIERLGRIREDFRTVFTALDAATAERDALKSIVATDDTCFGAPRFDGDRLPVECVARPILESGVTVAEQMEDYDITEAQVNAAVHWWQAVGKTMAATFDALTAERDAAQAALQAGIDAWMSEHPHAENAEELAFLWREFVACDEAHLAPDARALRRQLLAVVNAERDAWRAAAEEPDPRTGRRLLHQLLRADIAAVEAERDAAQARVRELEAADRTHVCVNCRHYVSGMEAGGSMCTIQGDQYQNPRRHTCKRWTDKRPPRTEDDV